MAGRPRRAGARVPAAASAAPGSVKAVDDPNLGSLFMDASQANPTDNSVTVNAGEKVTFAYPEGTNAHNVAFNAVGPQPTACKQLTGHRHLPDRSADRGQRPSPVMDR